MAKAASRGSDFSHSLSGGGFTWWLYEHLLFRIIFIIGSSIPSPLLAITTYSHERKEWYWLRNWVELSCHPRLGTERHHPRIQGRDWSISMPGYRPQARKSLRKQPYQDHNIREEEGRTKDTPRLIDKLGSTSIDNSISSFAHRGRKGSRRKMKKKMGTCPTDDQTLP